MCAAARRYNTFNVQAGTLFCDSAYQREASPNLWPAPSQGCQDVPANLRAPVHPKAPAMYPVWQVASGTLSSASLDRYSSVALAGVATEYVRYGQAEGGLNDIQQLDGLLRALQVRCVQLRVCHATLPGMQGSS